MAKTSSGDFGGFDPIFKRLNLFAQALISLTQATGKTLQIISCWLALLSEGHCGQSPAVMGVPIVMICGEGLELDDEVICLFKQFEFVFISARQLDPVARIQGQKILAVDM